MQDFERLLVWQHSMDLAEMIYERCTELPASERFGLAAQMQRSIVSVASNIAEGAGRPSQRDFARFLGIAAGSASELLAQLFIAERVHELGLQPEVAKCRVLRKMLWRLHGKVANAPGAPPTSNAHPRTEN